MNGCKPGQYYVGDRLLPMQHATPPPPPSPLHVGDGSKGTARPLQFGISDVAGVARMRLSKTTNALATPTPDFSKRFTPDAIPEEGQLQGNSDNC